MHRLSHGGRHLGEYVDDVRLLGRTHRLRDVNDGVHRDVGILVQQSKIEVSRSFEICELSTRVDSMSGLTRIHCTVTVP